MSNTNENFLYGNNTACDLGLFHVEIVAALIETGAMPEALDDLFVATPVSGGNPDGTPRYMIDAR